MSYQFFGSISVIALLAGTSAGWSLTGQEAWGHWKKQAETFGLVLAAGSETTDGDKLVLEDVTYSYAWEEIVSVRYAMGTMALTDGSDGSVSVALSDASSILVAITPPEDQTLEVSLEFTHPGASTTVTQQDDVFQEHTMMPELGIGLGPVLFDSVPDDSFTVAGSFSLQGLEYTRRTTRSGTPVISTESSIATMGGGYTFAVPDENMRMKNESQASDMVSTGELALGSLLDEVQSDLSELDEAAVMEMIGRVLDSGFSLQATQSIGSSTSHDEVLAENGDTMTNVVTGDTSAEISLNADGIRYGTTSGPFDVKATVPDIPVPEVQVSATGGEAALTFPFRSGSTPAPFGMRLGLRDLAIGEPLWSMVDPAAVLPRDPVNLTIDLSGSVRWINDLFSAETVEAMSPPVEPHTLDLNELHVSLLGVDLTGAGGFTFDNSDLETFGGMPRPEGEANLKLVGANALLENLTKLGIVPEDQVMMVRMMSGMFAVPGEGPDELKSTIAVTPDGRIMVNGAPVPF